jgi:hypothetical protein
MVKRTDLCGHTFVLVVSTCTLIAKVVVVCCGTEGSHSALPGSHQAHTQSLGSHLCDTGSHIGMHICISHFLSLT